MPVIEVSNVSKYFGSLKAVDQVSFEVKRGEIFGLLGPNGAGKTTILRLILDIYQPEEGDISILGGPMAEHKKRRIGYMPEERGLYQDAQLERVLVYLASLKGLPTLEARQRVKAYLEDFALLDYRRKKVKNLSKGMQQKAQIIATLLHHPELVIVDEPFSGLDPVNTQIIKQILLDLRDQGVTIIMSTHQMHQIEEMCDRILLIRGGKAVLYGQLEQVRQQFAGNAVWVRTPDPLPNLPGIERVGTPNHNSHTTRLTLSSETSPQEVLNQLVNQGVVVEKFEVALPTLHEIFVQVVGNESGGG